jgi:hypothetical protein
VQPPVVDPGRHGSAPRDRDRLGPDPLVRPLPLQPGELLGVVHALEVEPVGEDHRRCHQRPGQGPAPGLVGPGDPAEALRAEPPFVAVEV